MNIIADYEQTEKDDRQIPFVTYPPIVYFRLTKVLSGSVAERLYRETYSGEQKFCITRVNFEKKIVANPTRSIGICFPLAQN